MYDNAFKIIKVKIDPRIISDLMVEQWIMEQWNI